MQANPALKGLSSNEVIESRKLHGANSIQIKESGVFLQLIRSIVLEPMFLLLLTACVIYFVVGQITEGFFMLGAILIVAGISLFQEYRSRNAVQALKELSAPMAKVIRDGLEVQINTNDIVLGDILLLEEGMLVPADGRLMLANDFSVNESILTGESFPVYKPADEQPLVYKGTLITSGSGTIQVSAIGNATKIGEIGVAIHELDTISTPLQIQIKAFVKYMIWFGCFAFVLVVGYNYFKTRDILHAFMQGLTLAMSVIPEEIPVAFSTFMALGAFRLLKNKIIVKQSAYVETLGSATVICVDKTGTLTENKMSIAFLYDALKMTSIGMNEKAIFPQELIAYAMWSSETNPFDPMEKAIHQMYLECATVDERPLYKQVHEYPVSGRPPMMTHVFEDATGNRIIAAKGAAEAILKQCSLTLQAKATVEQQCVEYANKGYRVLAVAKGKWMGAPWPEQQTDIPMELLGLIVFFDPPKNGIKNTIQTFHEAGIKVKMITGDYSATALAISDQIQLGENRWVMTGEEVLSLSTKDLQLKVNDVNIFARMFPEAKLKVIQALEANGEIVAMTGDGVNDGPALKAANIGIAMGLRGSEVAKGAASLILMDDDLQHMTEAVELGRKIYENLKKAIRYIVSIHIPIILIVTLPLLMFWKFTEIFTPVHIIFLELIMGPTCSIIYENEPLEKGSMLQAPRKQRSNFLSGKQLLLSMIQGLTITAGCLTMGYYLIKINMDEPSVRTFIFITLLLSNIFLTLVNRSFYYSLLVTLRYKNNLVLLINSISLVFIALFLMVPPVQQLFSLHALTWPWVLYAILTAFVSTCWVELYKWVKRYKGKS